jgi:hypothetical protein
LGETSQDGLVSHRIHHIWHTYHHAGDTLARRLLEAAPMAEALENEYELLNTAIRERDPRRWKQWDAEFDAWMSGDRSGRCPFEAEEIVSRT